QVPGLALVGVPGECRGVGDAVVAGPCREQVPEGEGAERRVPAGAAAADRQPGGVGVAALDEEPGGRNAVVDVEDPPPALEPLPVLPAVAGAAAVVDVHDAEPAAGPELDLEAEGRRGGGGGPAVREHHQRWALAP